MGRAGIAFRVVGYKRKVRDRNPDGIPYRDRIDVGAVASPEDGTPFVAERSVGKPHARAEIEIAVEDSGVRDSRLLRGFDFYSKVLKIGGDSLRGISLVDIERHGMRKHQRVIRQIEASKQAVLRVRPRMHLPANPYIESESLADAEVVLNIRVDLLFSVVRERGVLHLAVGTRGAKEKIRILMAGIWAGAVIRSRGRIVDGGSLVGERYGVRRPVGKIAESFVPVTAAELQLVFSKYLCQVLVKSSHDLAHAVIELRTAIRHGQVGSDIREARLPEVIRKPQKLFVIRIDVAASTHILPHPLLTQDRL